MCCHVCEYALNMVRTIYVILGVGFCFVHVECKHFDWFQTINKSDYRFTFQLCAKWHYASTSFFFASSSLSASFALHVHCTMHVLWVLLLITLWNAIDTHKYSFYFHSAIEREKTFGTVYICVTNCCLIETLMRTFTRVIFNWKSFSPVWSRN